MQIVTGGEVSCDGADVVDNPSKAQKPRKAEILAGATTYVKQMEESNRLLREEIESLRARNQELERNTKCEKCWLWNEFGNMTVEGLSEWREHNRVYLETAERKSDGEDEEPSAMVQSSCASEFEAF